MNQITIGKDKNFTFDYVLPPRTTQDEVYEGCVKNLVNSIFEGYNATVFAYGQTVSKIKLEKAFLNKISLKGSGKTYTINGNFEREDEVGIIPRAVHSLFEIMKVKKKKNIIFFQL